MSGDGHGPGVMIPGAFVPRRRDTFVPALSIGSPLLVPAAPASRVSASPPVRPERQLWVNVSLSVAVASALTVGAIWAASLLR
jgi:hypothetical protein